MEKTGRWWLGTELNRRRCRGRPNGQPTGLASGARDAILAHGEVEGFPLVSALALKIENPKSIPTSEDASVAAGEKQPSPAEGTA